MVKQATKLAIEKIELPVQTVQAIQTTQYAPNITGVNNTCFGGFNLGLHVGDDEQIVLANRHYLQNVISPHCHIQWLDQVHGNEVIVAEHLITPYPCADAIITRTPNLALAIMTADCLPILLISKSGDEIAALHCGWRSTVNHIILNTLNKMNNEPKDIIAWLGPRISQKFFEVGEEVKNAFIELDPKLVKFFTINNAFKYQANLSGIAKYLLQKSGVTVILDDEQCTYANREKYYSYRRNNITGRMASIICITAKSNKR